MKLLYQNCGFNVAVGIEGSEEEINTQFDSFFNHGAIDKTADLQWMTPTFAFVWTDDARLKKYFRNSSYHIILNGIDDGIEWASKGLKFGAMVSRKIRELAADRWQRLLDNREVFVRYKKSGEFLYYRTRHGKILSYPPRPPRKRGRFKACTVAREVLHFSCHSVL